MTRIETGPLAFGEDWPGVFIRGDDALWYSMTLEGMISGIREREQRIPIMHLQHLLEDLRSCRVTGVGDPPGTLRIGGGNPLEALLDDASVAERHTQEI